MVDTSVEVENVNVTLPSGNDFSFVDSIKGIIDNIVNSFRDADEYVLTGIFMGFMLSLMFITIWRKA